MGNQQSRLYISHFQGQRGSYADRNEPTKGTLPDTVQPFTAHFLEEALVIAAPESLKEIRRRLAKSPVSDFVIAGEMASSMPVPKLMAFYNRLTQVCGSDFPSSFVSFRSEAFYNLLQAYAETHHLIQNNLSSYVFEPLEIRLKPESVKARQRNFLAFSVGGLEISVEKVHIRFLSEGKERYVGSTWADGNTEELDRVNAFKEEWTRQKKEYISRHPRLKCLFNAPLI